MPTLVLALNYWLHLLATVLWLGGLAMLVLLAWPSLAGQPPGEESAAGQFVGAVERRFRPLANVSLVVLLVTGMIQMGGDPHYAGLLQFGSPWSLSLLAKHLVIVGMVAVAALLQWGVYPALDRARLLAGRGDAAELRSAQRRLRRLAAVNLALGVVVLLLTAYMTAL